MIAILHGYYLEGSGSNLWTRSIVKALARSGYDLHLFCQENQPSEYDFISRAFYYPTPRKKVLTYEAKSLFKGNVFLHRPNIGNVLPVYIRDHYPDFDRVIPMTKLKDEQIGFYLKQNIETLVQIVKSNRISHLHANHTVMMPTVAQKVCETLKPNKMKFTIMPHGSALEYAVKQDIRFQKMGESALKSSKRIFVASDELKNRLITLFDKLDQLPQKIEEIKLGVDTHLFKIVKKEERKIQAAHFSDLLPDQEKKPAPKQFEEKKIDPDFSHHMAQINWTTDPVIIYVGRIIEAKGVHSIVTAFPKILEKHSRAKLIVAGHGPLRTPLTTLIQAIEQERKDQAYSIIQEENLSTTQKYLKNLDQNELDQYFKLAKHFRLSQSIFFSGYLNHFYLSQLLPLCDLALFPSVVKESGPLVFLESLASGCFPMGTYFAGMGASIDHASKYLDNQWTNLMKISPQPQDTILDIIAHSNQLLDLRDEIPHQKLRDIAVQDYDWENVSKRFMKRVITP